MFFCVSVGLHGSREHWRVWVCDCLRVCVREYYRGACAGEVRWCGARGLRCDSRSREHKGALKVEVREQWDTRRGRRKARGHRRRDSLAAPAVVRVSCLSHAAYASSKLVRPCRRVRAGKNDWAGALDIFLAVRRGFQSRGRRLALAEGCFSLKCRRRLSFRISDVHVRVGCQCQRWCSDCACVRVVVRAWLCRRWVPPQSRLVREVGLPDETGVESEECIGRLLVTVPALAGWCSRAAELHACGCLCGGARRPLLARPFWRASGCRAASATLSLGGSASGGSAKHRFRLLPCVCGEHPPLCCVQAKARLARTTLQAGAELRWRAPCRHIRSVRGDGLLELLAAPRAMARPPSRQVMLFCLALPCPRPAPAWGSCARRRPARALPRGTFPPLLDFPHPLAARVRAVDSRTTQAPSRRASRWGARGRARRRMRARTFALSAARGTSMQTPLPCGEFRAEVQGVGRSRSVEVAWRTIALARFPHSPGGAIRRARAQTKEVAKDVPSEPQPAGRASDPSIDSATGHSTACLRQTCLVTCVAHICSPHIRRADAEAGTEPGSE